MELSGSTGRQGHSQSEIPSLLFLLRKQAQFSDWNIFWTRRYIKKQSTPFDRASPKAQSMDFSKAFLSVVLSYAMRSLEFWAPKIVFFCSYLRNLWQCHQALIWLAGGCGAGVWGLRLLYTFFSTMAPGTPVPFIGQRCPSAYLRHLYCLSAP